MALVGTRATPDSPEQRQARDDSIRLLGEAGREPFWEELAPRIFADGADPAVVARGRELALEQPITALVTAQETIRDRVDSRPDAADDRRARARPRRRGGPADPAGRLRGDGRRAPECAFFAHCRRRATSPRSSGPTSSRASSSPSSRRSALVTGDELAELLEQGEVAVVDVRSAEEFEGIGRLPVRPATRATSRAPCIST